MRQHADLKFKTIDGDVIYAHKGILSVRARYLFYLISGHQESLTAEASGEISELFTLEYETDVVEEILRYVYYNEVENLDELAFKLYRAASDYDLANLKRFCYNYISLNLSTENAVESLITAQHVGAPKELINRSFELIVA